MSKYKDLTGQRFGMLEAVQYVASDKHGNALWKCCCDCGRKSIVPSKDLCSGNTRSCGCYRKTFAVTHGATVENDPDYERWKAMKKRCTNARDRYYHRYGGRGIKVFSMWLHDFGAFRAYIQTLLHYGEPGTSKILYA